VSVKVPAVDADEKDGVVAEPEAPTRIHGTPRWVKVFGIVTLALVVLLVVVLVTGGGNHGPRRHAPAGGAGTPAVSLPERHNAPTGAHTQP
jgi:hypothetical protein